MVELASELDRANKEYSSGLTIFIIFTYLIFRKSINGVKIRSHIDCRTSHKRKPLSKQASWLT